MLMTHSDSIYNIQLLLLLQLLRCLITAFATQQRLLFGMIYLLIDQ